MTRSMGGCESPLEAITVDKPEALIRTRVKFEAVKIHRVNSPQVLSGEVSEGHREVITTEEYQTVELTHAQCVEMFGQQAADEMFQRKDGT